MVDLKQELYKRCLLVAEERIKTAQNAIMAAREASEDDTKSSAGDKYETTREMMQQEISRNEIQLAEARKLKQSLSKINPDKNSDTILPGSLVITNKGTFFISISAGSIEMDGKTIFTVSPASPIGQQLRGLRAGETFHFNGKEFKIQEVY
jgi:transcription elongation GreA/GreB family factor